MQRRLLAARGAVASLQEREHVLLAHAPAAAGARHLVEVDAVLRRDPLDDGRVAASTTLAVVHGRLGRGLRPAEGASAGAAVSGAGAGSSVASAGVAPTAAAASELGGTCSVACASPGFASVAIRARTTPTSTVVPTSTRISVTRPLAGDGTSVSILSVEMSQMVSSASTQSPGCLRHSTTVPSATDTPIWGMVTSTVVLVGEELTARLLHAIDARQQSLLERR